MEENGGRGHPAPTPKELEKGRQKKKAINN
jgi:hypothetical protein